MADDEKTTYHMYFVDGTHVSIKTSDNLVGNKSRSRIRGDNYVFKTSELRAIVKDEALVKSDLPDSPKSQSL